MSEPLPEYWSKCGTFGVRIESDAATSLLTHCRASKRFETGGILVGRYSHDRRLASITAISGPSPDTRAGAFWLIRGVQGLHSWLVSLWKQNATHYVGEWHFHPFAPPTPSQQDVRQMNYIAATGSYQCAEPILLIIGGDPDESWILRIEVHTRFGHRHVLIRHDDRMT